MNVFTHASCFPCNKGLGNSKKNTPSPGPSPPQNKGAGYLCGYLYARGSGKAATPQDSWESERSEYLGKALKLKSFRGSMGEMAWHIYLYIYITYVVDFCGKCR